MKIITLLSEINKKIEQMQKEDQFGNYFFVLEVNLKTMVGLD